MIEEAKPAPASRAQLAFRLCTGREPKSNELDAILANYQSQRETFQQHPRQAAKVAGAGADEADMAAWIMISNSLLNLDETVTKE